MCETCGGTRAVLRWQTFRNQSRHIRATCVRCKSFIMFVAQDDANTSEADKNEAWNG